MLNQHMIVPFVVLVISIISQKIPMSHIETVIECRSYRMYYDTVLMRCVDCPKNSKINKNSNFDCECNPGYYQADRRGNGAIECIMCPKSHPIQSIDGFGCVRCDESAPNCSSGCPQNYLPYETTTNGSYHDEQWQGTLRLSTRKCIKCGQDQKRLVAIPNLAEQRCVSCRSRILNNTLLKRKYPCDCNDGRYCFGFNRTSGHAGNQQDSLRRLTRLSGTKLESAYLHEHLMDTYRLCQAKVGSASNLTACNALINMATVQHFDREGVLKLIKELYEVHDKDPVTGSTLNIPAVEYSNATILDYYSGKFGTFDGYYSSTLQDQEAISIFYAHYALDGTFLGWNDFIPAPCGALMGFRMTRPTIGFECKKKCYIQAKWITVNSALDPRFFEAYLNYRDTVTGKRQFVPIPILIANQYPYIHDVPSYQANIQKVRFFRRFFSFDRKTTVPRGAKTPSHITVLTEFRVFFWFPSKHQAINKIRLPIIKVTYTNVEPHYNFNKVTVPVEVAIKFNFDMASANRNFLVVSMTISMLMSLAKSILLTFRWSRRQRLTKPGPTMLIYLSCKLLGSLADCIFVMITFLALHWLIFDRPNSAIMDVSPVYLNDSNLNWRLLIIGSLFKTIDIVHLVCVQVSADPFFIDWESPRLMTGSTIRKGCGWRLFFVANEWYRLQATRRISCVSQMLTTLIMMRLAMSASGKASVISTETVFMESVETCGEPNQLVQIALFVIFWTASAIAQRIFYSCGYSRVVKDRLSNLVDLCSVANISIFVLSERFHGYYVHGRSPHGFSDIEFSEIVNNLKKERDNLCGARGLVMGSNEQVFEVMIQPAFRTLLNKTVAKAERARKGWHILFDRHERSSKMVTNVSFTEHSGHGVTYGNDEPFKLSRNQVLEEINDLLKGYVEHTLNDDSYDYIIRPKRSTERILDIELDELPGKGVFYTDANNNKFEQLTFYGYEWSFFVWNALIFMSVNYHVNRSGMNVVVPAVFVVVLQWSVDAVRKYVSAIQIKSKTMMDSRLLF